MITSERAHYFRAKKTHTQRREAHTQTHGHVWSVSSCAYIPQQHERIQYKQRVCQMCVCVLVFVCAFVWGVQGQVCVQHGEIDKKIEINE